MTISAFTSITSSYMMLRCIGVWDGEATGARIDFPASQYQNLKSFFLYDVRINDNVFVSQADRFPHLENLKIECCILTRIEILSSSLREIQLIRNHGLEEAQFDAPSIILFEYVDNKYLEYVDNEYRSLLPLLSFTAATSRWESHIKLECRGARVDTSLFLKLTQFLARLNHSEIYITFGAGEFVYFDPTQMKRSLVLSEAQVIQEFTIRGSSLDDYPPSAQAILNNIFLTFRPHTLSYYYSCDSKLSKLLYGTLIVGINQRNYRFGKTKIWQRCLKDVNDVKISEVDWDRVASSRKRRRTLELPQALSWKNFFEELESYKMETGGPSIISFNLEWKTFD